MQSEIDGVTIICLTYNHEKYIGTAIQSFLSQKTTFPIEIIIHDDASTDKTSNVIKEFEKKDPRIISICQTVNQYSTGSRIILDILLPKVRTKYFAFCEGDDYWIDSEKLQKQYDAMNAHPNINLCAHAFEIRDAQTGELIRIDGHGNKQSVLPLSAAIIGEGGFVGTNTLMYRTQAFDHLLPFLSIMSHDYPMQLFGALRGGILYLPEVMSVYRYAVPNSFCTRIRKDPERELAYIARKVQMLQEFDRNTGGMYHGPVEARLLLYETSENKAGSVNVSILKRYRLGFPHLSAKDRAAVLLKCICPGLLRLVHRINSAHFPSVG